MSAQGDGGWACSVCTFFNEIDHDMCSLCLHSRAFSQHITALQHVTALGQLAEHAALIASSSRTGFNVPRILCGALTGALTGMFAIVGALTGAVTGAFAGRATDSGLFRGAGLGALAGAVLSVEVLDAYRGYFSHERSAGSAASSMVGFVEDILTGRFVHEQLGPALITAHRWQVNPDDMHYDDLYEMFGSSTQPTKGASRASLAKLPCHLVSFDNRRDAAGDNICCAICLQDLQQGEMARSLPPCQHTFHLNCVDRWLTQHGTCPVCRHDI